MKLFIYLYFILFASQSIRAKPDSCIKLRKFRAQCESGKTEQVHITCGGKWYRYWTDEFDMFESRGESDFTSNSQKGMCIHIQTETMTMDCYDFLDYKVSLFFCRKQKKQICHKLKEDGFGDITLEWPRKKKKYRGEQAEQGYITKPCSEVLN